MRLEEAKRDHYRRRAKEDGYRSRAAYKLLQINQKHRIIGQGSKVVDIGCAPGGWLQVSSDIVGPRGIVVGVDIAHFRDVNKRNVLVLRDDVTSQGFPERLIESMKKGKADCVLADLSPKLSGIWDMDHFKQIELCQRVVDLLPEVLTRDGSCVMKAFHGAELDPLIKRLRSCFDRVDISKPEASRNQSSEVYLVSTGFNAQVPSRPPEPHEAQHRSEQLSDSDESYSLTDRLT